MRTLLSVAVLAASVTVAAQDKQVLWGDTHLHSTYSSDAYANQNLLAKPDVAFSYAKGLPVIHPYHKARVQIETPLDFMVTSDHAELLGVIRSIHRDGADTSELGPIDTIKAWVAEYVLTDALDKGTARKLFVGVLPDPDITPLEDANSAMLSSGDVSLLPAPKYIEANAWKAITNTADQHNDPGNFTAFIGWEWSSIPGGANLHRIVITDSDAPTAQQYDPFGLDDSPFPEDLWAWLEKTSAETCASFTAIPHNSNISKGYMFDTKSLRGEAITPTYAKLRSKYERIAEITQIKGDSETHSSQSPNDEFADFENFPYYLQRKSSAYEPKAGDFIRSALKRGLQLEQDMGVNPYRIGVIGSTDAHTSLPSAEESNFHGKLATDSIPANKDGRWNGKDGRSANGWDMSASGLAAVWAEDNTREAIMQAMQRREVYASTGPRIGVQFFAGNNYVEADLDTANLYKHASSKGVPMGGELAADAFGEGVAPSFIVAASKDPKGANLDRIQIVKGWVDTQGDAHEKVYNVAWSDSREQDAAGNLPVVGNTVNLKTGAVDNTIGAEQLIAVWQDPVFDPSQSAFYYTRVLQIPTARHSLMDAIALGLEHAGDAPDTIQERAYTASIWYRP